jgi:hypothetical protein
MATRKIRDAPRSEHARRSFRACRRRGGRRRHNKKPKRESESVPVKGHRGSQQMPQTELVPLKLPCI